MIRHFKGALAGAVLVLGICGSTYAAPVTLYFSGTLFNVRSMNGAGPLGAIANGDAIQGSVSFDADLAQYHATNNMSYRQDYSYLPYVSLNFNDLATGGSTSNLGRTYQNYSATMIQRNDSSDNSYQPWHVEAYDYSAGRFVNYISSLWNVRDADGALSTLFANPSGGLAYGQPVNLAGKTQGSFIQEMSSSAAGVLYNNTANFSVDYIGLQPVPLPAAGWLLFSGLLGLAGTVSGRRIERVLTWEK